MINQKTISTCNNTTNSHIINCAKLLCDQTGQIAFIFSASHKPTWIVKKRMTNGSNPLALGGI